MLNPDTANGALCVATLVVLLAARVGSAVPARLAGRRLAVRLGRSPDGATVSVAGMPGITGPIPFVAQAAPPPPPPGATRGLGALADAVTGVRSILTRLAQAIPRPRLPWRVARAGESQLNDLFDGIPLCAALLDRGGRVLRVNRAGRKALASRAVWAKQVEGRLLVDMHLPDAGADLRVAARAAIAHAAAGETVQLEDVSLSGESDGLSVALTFAPIRGAGDRPSRVVVSVGEPRQRVADRSPRGR